MTIRFHRPVSQSARLSGACGKFAFLLFVVVFAGHRAGLLATPFFVALVLLAALLAVLAVPLGIIGLQRLWSVGALGGVAATQGLIFAILPLVFTGIGAVDYFRYPPIYDISTDMADAPAWLAPPVADQVWLPRYPVTERDREAQQQAYPGLTGRRYEGAIDRVYQAVTKVATQNGFKLVKVKGLENTQADIIDMPAKPASEDAAVADTLDNVPIPLPRPVRDLSVPDPAYLAAGRDGDVLIQEQVRTLVVGFRFDTVIRLREEAETTFVDIRVVSRYGPHDLGQGAAIAESYLRALDAELLGIAGG